MSAFGLALTALWACTPTREPLERSAAAFPVADTYVGSSSCVACHPDATRAWEGSHHARAERALGSAERAALAQLPGVTLGVSVQLAVPRTVEPDGVGEVVAVIGVEPLWQPLVALADGRVLVYAQAWDPVEGEWFQVVDPPPPEGAWDHWTGRGRVWNVQCASCHVTGLNKGWNAETDGYATTFVERGVGCEACHGPSGVHVAEPASPVPVPTPGFDTCAPCHSRRAALTDTATPGAPFLDGYAPLLVSDGELYWPDGQVRQEVFEAVAYLGSRMHQAGVTCADCHVSHTGATRRAGDDLCLGCHAGRPGFKLHDHHAVDSAGARCTGCHMPSTVYMQRDPRHDHGFAIPDPALGVLAGVPDACTKCHTDHDASWAAATVEQWYGPALRPSAERSRAFAASASPAGLPALLQVAVSDPHPFWRASAMGVLGAFVGEKSVLEVLVGGATDADPLVRYAAAGALADRSAEPAIAEVLTGALADPTRAVRVQATRARRRTIDPRSQEGSALRAYLDANADQPEATLESGQWWLERGDIAVAWPFLARAVAWDPANVQARMSLAYAALRLKRPEDARVALVAATELAPELGAAWLALALALEEQGDVPAAIAVLDRGMARVPGDPRLRAARGRLAGQGGPD